MILYMGDFETTVEENTKQQKHTEVWASGLAQIGSEFIRIDNSIGKTYEFLLNQLEYDNIIVYYHNLKFDGVFWIDYMLRILKLKTAVYVKDDQKRFAKPRELRDGQFTCSISGMGQFYRITMKMHGHTLELRDSLKLIPASVAAMGKSYNTKHQKLEMEYVGNHRHAGGKITPEERKYLINDLLVVKEVLEIMFSEGHNRLTIGSCCMHEFKSLYTKLEYEREFPDVSKMKCALGEKTVIGEKTIYEFPDMDAYIRKTYRGAWCYLKPEYANRVLHCGITADVNSLYPSVMHSDSGNYYPIGKPKCWKGNHIPNEALLPERYYFLRVRTRFYLKRGKLPTVQIKNNRNYKPTEWLTTSDIYNQKTEKYYREYIGTDGQVHPAVVELSLTMTDWELLKAHYNLEDTEIIDGCWFYAKKGIFDNYINKYAEIKKTNKGAKRNIAKLYLNNLYGKLASSKNSNFKIPYLDSNGVIAYESVIANEKQPGYIPCGSVITSYARYFTITHAQKNYKYFVYADTDSIHCICRADQLVGLRVHPTDFNSWKLESTWDQAIFVRQKTYIEHVYEEDLSPCKPFYNIKCSGMSDRPKKLFNVCLQTAKLRGDIRLQRIQELIPDLNEEELEFMKTIYKINDFTLGLCVPSKLLPRRVDGGIVLIPTTYKMR